MIDDEQVMPLLLDASPSFREVWARHMTPAAFDATQLYVYLCEFVHHLAELVKRGWGAELAAVFDVVERLRVEGDDAVQHTVTHGILGPLRDMVLGAGIDLQQLMAMLKPETAKLFSEIDEFWDGKELGIHGHRKWR